jgi:hypothetical protein
VGWVKKPSPVRNQVSVGLENISLTLLQGIDPMAGFVFFTCHSGGPEAQKSRLYLIYSVNHFAFVSQYL